MGAVLQAASAQPLTDRDPRQLGRWKMIARIGSGGMGVVYKATDDVQVAAVKVVRSGLLDDLQVLTRFEREAAVLRAVRDLHISQFLDADVQAEPAWLATEYIAGPNLRDAIRDDGPLEVTQWWTVARGLAQALAVLQIHGITHRDIKPANVILADRGPVLIDFGIAQPEDSASLTVTGMVTGSPSWLSPEQVRMVETTSESDVFSLGSLMAYAATGRAPFGQGVSVAILRNIVGEEPDLDGIDDRRAALLRRMLAKQPEDRIPVRELLEYTRSMADQTELLEADTTQPISAPTRTFPAPGAPPVMAAAPVAGRATAPAGPTPPPIAPRRSTGGRPPTWVIVLLAAVAAFAAGFFATQWGQDSAPGGQPAVTESAPTPSETSDPSSGDQLNSGDWLLSQYSISPANDGTLVIDGTVVNRSDSAASATLTVDVFEGTELVATAVGDTGEVAAGASTSVKFTSDDPWVPGNPVLVVRS